MSVKDTSQITKITTIEREKLRESLVQQNLQIDAPEELDLGGLLLKSGFITEEQLAQAVTLQTEEGHQRRLGEILLQQKIITEVQLLDLLSRQLGIPFIRSINDREIPEDLIRKVPTRFAKKFHVLPVGYRENDVLVVTSDPLNTAVIDDVRLLLEKTLWKNLIKLFTTNSSSL
jgi:hypothetical protein